MISRLRQALLPQFQAIHDHPFNVGLANGTLPPAVFQFFLEQDDLYLHEFAKALRMVAERCDNQKYAQQFHEFSNETQLAERQLHSNYLLKATKPTLFAPKPAKIPVIEEYARHLLLSVREPEVEVAIASLMPCYLIYCELGATMIASPDNPYYSWIATYSSEDFRASAEAISKIFESLVDGVLCPQKIEKISSAFKLSTQFELEFFDSVCRHLNLMNANLEERRYRHG